MSHFAKVINGLVTEVIVAEQTFINSGLLGDPSWWIQTSYNTHGGQHPEGRPLRKNYAASGYLYDQTRDAFIPPRPYASWVLNEETCLWEAPVQYPSDGQDYAWNEENICWVPVDPVNF